MKKISLCTLCAGWALSCATPTQAHHGVASLGVAGLEGPGAPVESSSSATLPKGSVLGYLKLDYAAFKTYTPASDDDEGDHSAFWMAGVGYGLLPYLSAYVFAPYNAKSLENDRYDASGVADLSVMGVLGFKHDAAGFQLVPAQESLDDLEDWHFTVYGGLTLPTGDANRRNADGDIDPGMALGFGKPAYSLGLTATKQISERGTLTFDTSYLHFQDSGYDDGNRTQFGQEWRVNTAFNWRLWEKGDRKLRLDGILEANYLQLGRDRSNGLGELATGGDILYAVPGLRLYYDQLSLGLGVKVPVWTGLNEEEQQQGAEGKERYRLILTFSALF